MKKSIVYVLGLVLMIMTGTACNKKKDGTFTIRGTLIEDCSNKPIRGQAIYARDQIRAGHGLERIGATTTDANGHFELVCDYYGPDPKEVKGLPGEYETSAIPENRIIDLGTIYSGFTTTVTVAFNVTGNHVNDTLFFRDAYVLGQVDTIYPILPGLHYYSYPYHFNSAVDGAGMSIRNGGNRESFITYSIGIAGINSYLNKEKYQIVYCGQSDTVSFALQ